VLASDKIDQRLTGPGAADSGKSTIIKQMRIIHHGGFTDDERRMWKGIIFRNLVDAFLYLINIMAEQNIELQDSENIVSPLTLRPRPLTLRSGTFLFLSTGARLAGTRACRSSTSTVSRTSGPTPACSSPSCATSSASCPTISHSKRPPSPLLPP
jgi:hypothetical protein